MIVGVKFCEFDAKFAAQKFDTDFVSNFTPSLRSTYFPVTVILCLKHCYILKWLNLTFRKIIGLVSHLLNAYCFLQFFDGLVVSPHAVLLFYS